MVERRVVVQNALGLHARPATKVVQTASRFRSDIVLEAGGQTADAKSIMSLIQLAAARNATVVIRAKGDDEKEAAETVAQLFDARFGEE